MLRNTTESTMSSRERVTRALRFEYPDRAPRDLWVLPGIPMYRQAELDVMLEKYPTDFAFPDFSYGLATRSRGIPSQVGTYIDEWGCGWKVAEPGVVGEVKSPPLAHWSNLASYQPPFEVIENADFSRVNLSCANSEKFMLVWGTAIRPFERLQFLRGTEALFIDLAYGTAEVMQLLEMVHEYFLRELALWVKTDVDGIAFMDDWGTQNALLISPKMWQAIFKPLYAEYVDIIHAAGKFAFMHSDGHISAIYPDIVEIGVDALNSQLFCMDIEQLAREFKGKITFWGEIDRQKIMPFGTVDDVKEGVRRVRRALDDSSGGIIAECEWGVDVAASNVSAVYDAWLEPLSAI